MVQRDPVAIVNAWVEAVNANDADRLVALSDGAIEVAGPRGSGTGHRLLLDWMERADLTLETRRIFTRGGTVVLDQWGIWRDPRTGELTGERPLASLFYTDERVVVRFERFDGLEAALEAAALDYADEREGED